MPTVTLNDVAIRAFPCPDGEQVTYWDKSLKGFGVRVSRGGTKAFVLVHGADRRRTTIGRHPAVTLKDARNAAKKLLAERELGIATPKRAITFDEAKARFLAASAQKNRPRTTLDYRARLGRHFRFGKRPLSEITRADITMRLAKAKTTPAEQNHAFVALRVFFNWALREELIDANPMAHMKLPNHNQARERVLSDAELGAVYIAAREHPYPFGAIVSLLVLTGMRRGEVAALRWEWIDQNERLITLPSDFTKNRRTHVMPYGDLAATVFSGLPELSKYLFPARTETSTIFNGWGKAKRRFDDGLENVQPYTLHDVRRTFGSLHAKLGTPIHVTEKLLNHVSGTISGVAAVYNRHTYADEMRVAVEEYEEYLAGIVSSAN